MLADVLVMSDHHVVVVALAALALVLLGGVRAEVHGGRVVPHEERLVRLVRLVDEAQGMFGDLIVDRLHALLRQRPRVFDAAIGKAVDHAARAIALLEFRILRVIRVLRLLFGIEVIEVAKELVEAVVGGQELIPVAQVVLAELAGDVAMRLEQLGDGGILRLQPESRRQACRPWSGRCGSGSGR